MRNQGGSNRGVCNRKYFYISDFKGNLVVSVLRSPALLPYKKLAAATMVEVKRKKLNTKILYNK